MTVVPGEKTELWIYLSLLLKVLDIHEDGLSKVKVEVLEWGG